MRLTKQHQPQYDTPPYPSTVSLFSGIKYTIHVNMYTQHTRIHVYTHTRVPEQFKDYQ